MDIVDLREFYSSRLGQTTRRLISARLRPRLAGTAGATVVGLGYAIPYLEDCAGEAGRRLALMLARQGVITWPAEGEVSSALVDEFDLPLLESIADVVLVTHGLELTEGPEEMLAEIWRVLAPQGRLLLVVPNRRGLWARFDNSPFGHGQPYSRPQLARLLRDARFAISSWSQVLYLPPLQWSLLHNAAGAMEALGGRVMPGLAGAIVVEATKQVYAIAPGKRVRRVGSRLKPALTPVAPRLKDTGTARNALLLPGHTL